MKYSFCPSCGETQLREIVISEPVYGYNGGDEVQLLRPAVIRIFCPYCRWKEEYNEDQ